MPTDRQYVDRTKVALQYASPKRYDKEHEPVLQSAPYQRNSQQQSACWSSDSELPHPAALRRHNPRARTASLHFTETLTMTTIISGSQKPRTSDLAWVICLALIATLSGGCKQASPSDPPAIEITEGTPEAHNSGDGQRQFSFSEERLVQFLAGPSSTLHLQATASFTRTNFIWEGSHAQLLEVRAKVANGSWTQWQPIAVTLDQQTIFNGFVNFQGLATAMEVRRLGSEIPTSLFFEFAGD